METKTDYGLKAMQTLITLTVEASRAEGFLRGIAMNPDLGEPLRTQASELAEALRVVIAREPRD